MNESAKSVEISPVTKGRYGLFI